MIVSFNKYKYQIIISTILGSLYYSFTKNEFQSIALTLILVIFLRYVKIDKTINNLINKKTK